MVSLSCRISPRTSTVIFLDRSPLATAVVTSAMLRTWAVRLPAIELTESVRSFQVPATPLTLAWPPSLPSVPTSRATRVTSEAKELSCSTMVLAVLAVRRNWPSSGRPVHVQRHGLRQVALGHRADDARHLGGRPHQVVDQRVDGLDHRAPAARHADRRGALRELALAPDHAADAVELLGHALVGVDDVVEDVGDLAGDSGQIGRQAHRPVALAERQQGAEQLAIEGCVYGGRARSACSLLLLARAAPIDAAGAQVGAGAADPARLRVRGRARSSGATTRKLRSAVARARRLAATA